MPSSMPHLIVAKKIIPNANIDFYMGTLAPDAVKERTEKEKVHFAYVSDIENALKAFSLKADNDYLKGFLLHLYTDWKWNTTHLSDFINKTNGSWYPAYREEIGKVTAYAFHNTEWAHSLYEELEFWDFNGFVETEFITKDSIKEWIGRSKKWRIENKREPSLAFPPTLIETFTNNTASDFIKWFSESVDKPSA